jgi:hypothetical protein
MSLRTLLTFDLSAEARASIEQAVSAVNGLRPNIDPAHHMPVYTTALDGSPARVVGCSCGEKPRKPAAAMSQTMSFFNSHLARVGVSRNYDRDGNQTPRYTDGLRAGMTMMEALNAGL